MSADIPTHVLLQMSTSRMTSPNADYCSTLDHSMVCYVIIQFIGSFTCYFIVVAVVVYWQKVSIL